MKNNNQNFNTMTNLIKILESVRIPSPNSKKTYSRILLNEFKRASKAGDKIRARDVLHLALIHEAPAFEEMLDASEYTLQEIQRRVKYHITNINGYWTLNGSRYSEMNNYEKAYFNEFLTQIKS